MKGKYGKITLASDPASASVRQKAANFRAVAKSGKYFSFCSSVP